MIQILHDDNLGLGLEKDSATKQLRIKIKENSALSVDATGLDVTIPTAPTAVKTIAVEDNHLVVTDTTGNAVNVELPAQTVDVKASNLSLNEDNELVVELTDGTVLKQSLAKFIDIAKSAQAYHDEIKELEGYASDVAAKLAASQDAVALIAQKVLESLKGEEVQDFAGASKGFLLKAAL